MWEWVDRFITFLILVCLISYTAYGQQEDVNFHLTAHLLTGQKLIKVKRDFNDYYVWVLASNNQVYRINSQTLVIDDYTAKFAAYNNFQFIDIAGSSKDTVFLACNAANVVEYKSGVIRLIGSSDGLPGPVNSIGMSGGLQLDHTDNSLILMIASSKGFRWYNTKTEQIIPPNSAPGESTTGDSKIYETTYRTEFYKDSTAQSTDFIGQDTIQYQPVVDKENGSVVRAWIWEGGKEFGNNINTAVNIYGDINADQVESNDYFWGDKKGMFQCWSGFCYWSAHDTWAHYLDGINVNKITSIYGLTALGSNSSIIKQNLLVGTDNGFYFSTSTYNSAANGLRTFSLFHDDELGNSPINDICVNAVPDSRPICENGVWLASNDGLYLVKPDYAAYLNKQQLPNAISFKNQPGNIDEMQVCADTTLTALIDVTNYNGNSIQWYKDGAELPNESKDSLSIKTPGDYNALIYDPCENIHLESNHLKVDIISAPTFAFNYPAQLNYCAGSSTSLKVQDNNNTYRYRWYKDGVLNGVTTNSITVNQPGNYKVEVSACANDWVPSAEVQVNFIEVPTPLINSDKPAYCIGDNATLKVTVPVDPSYTINWYKDNILLPADANLGSITANIAGNYTVSVISNTVNTDGSVCSQISPSQPVLFNPKPTVSIDKIVNTTLCAGQTISLKAIYTNGNIKWSTGETTDEIDVKDNGNYTLTLTSATGCTADTSITVAFLSNPMLNVKDTTICTYKNQIVTLIAPEGFSQYSWNNQPGGQTYPVSHPETVNLTVTDANGCQASQQIQVTEQCPDIEIPNAFTPNNDGINDTWVVEGLDETSDVKVFNRYGSQVYESKGYTLSWNGEYKGKKLPAGVYYYIITAKNNKQRFSGSLTIIY